MHALSVPTWIIHVSSVIEWMVATWLVWTYGDVSSDRVWRYFSYAMLPALVGALCACTWHFFDNSPSLDWLVTVQASMTVIGNCTLLLPLGGFGGLLKKYFLSFKVNRIMLSKDTLFAVSLFPYLGFLWFITRSGKMPRLALTGFYVLLVFVAVTIPAGIYAKIHYGEQLADVDWLHGAAESFLTLSNILIVLGFRQAIIERKNSAL